MSEEDERVVEELWEDSGFFEEVDDLNYYDLGEYRGRERCVPKPSRAASAPQTSTN